MGRSMNTDAVGERSMPWRNQSANTRRAAEGGAPLLLGFVLCLAALSVRADLIDFESGFLDLQQVGAVVSATNTVTFSLKGGIPVFIAQAGVDSTGFVKR